MNHAYRVVWNASQGIWQAVSELARASGGKSGRSGKAARRARAVLRALLPLGIALPAWGQSVTITGDVQNASIGTAGPGTVTVDGAGASWASSGSLVYVGESANGTLTIRNGGSVTSSLAFIGNQYHATGIVTVDGAGSSWTNITTLFVGGSGDGTLNITNGGSVTSGTGRIGSSGTGTVTVDGSGSSWSTTGAQLHVGVGAKGVLNITNGGSVSSGSGVIGLNAPGTGISTVTVDGTGSTWTTNNANLLVGQTSAAILNIQNGGSVSSGMGYIGLNGTGTVTVDGPASSWTTNNNYLYVGYAASGALNITNSGSVSNKDGYIGYNGPGTVTVDGAGSSWTNSRYLFVGTISTGSLNITNGGTVASSAGFIGNGPTSPGTVIVDGPGSSWTNSASINVGGGGNGILNVTNGGTVSSGSVIIGAGGTGTVTVDGARSSWTTNLNATYIGYASSGILNLTNGGSASSGAAFIGTGPTASGTVKVDGPGSSWVNAASMYVGNGGTGILNITRGGAVSSGAASIGAGGNGTVTIDGAGSSLKTTGGSLVVGDASTGILNITNGGTVSGGAASIGVGGNGTVTVDGAGSSLSSASGNVVVGGGSTGILNITNGGTVSGVAASIGAGGNGTVTVDGAGSSLTTGGNLIVGGTASGVLNIANGGSVSAGSLGIGTSTTGNGALNLTTGGVLQTGYLQKGSGSAGVTLSNATLRATGDRNDFLPGFSAGDITIKNGGAYVDTQTYNVGIATPGVFTGTGSLTKQGTGTLAMAGGNTWSGDTTISAGTLTLDSYTQSSNQTLNINAASTSDFGKLKVNGTATFNTGANLAVDVTNLKTLAIGQVFTGVVSAGALSASTFNVTDNSALFNFKALLSGNTVNLAVVSASPTAVYDAVNAYGLWPARGAAQTLDAQLQTAPTGDMANVVTALAKLSDPGDVARAAAQTLPMSSSSQAIMNTLSSFNRIVSDRAATGETGLSTGDAMADKRVWIKPFGSHASQNDENGASGFSANTWGLAVGAEADWYTTRLGLAYAYANTRVNGNTALSGASSNAQINSNVLALYGGRPVHGFDLNFQVDTGWNHNSSQRAINIGSLNSAANGGYSTWSAHAGTGLSKTLPLSSDLTFIPEVRVDYTRLRSQSYSENGADALSLNVNGTTVQALLFGVDARMVKDLGNYGKINAHLGVGYDAINDPGNIVAAYAGLPGQSFSTPGLTHSPWLMTAGVGYEYRTAGGTSIALRYDVQARSGFVNQSASLKVSWLF